MQVGEVERELPKALVGWYPFEKGRSVLFVIGDVDEYEVLADVLGERGLDTKRCREKEVDECKKMFDYIVVAGAVEVSKRPGFLLKKLKCRLGTGGRMLIVANNRMAIRYFCGDKDEYTGHVLDGIDNYAKINPKRMEELRGRVYSKAELKDMLLDAGFKRQKFYSIMPSLVRPQVLISEEYVPNEALDVRVFPQYNCPQTVFLEEERLYEDLLKNGMFHSMANGFLIECSVDGQLTDVDQITVSGDRGRENALATIIKNGKSVSKKALYVEGQKKIMELLENTRYLRAHNVMMVDARLEKESFLMPYVEGEIATQYFRRLLRKDKNKFIVELDEFRNIILGSSDIVSYDEVNWRQFEPGWEKRKPDDPNIDKWSKLAFGSQAEQDNIGTILKRGYIDLVSLNCFHTKDGFVFFDQEFYLENLPVNVIFMRTIDLIYRDCADLELILPSSEVLKYFHLWEHQEVWRKYVALFIKRLRNEEVLASYHRRHRRDWRTMVSNRHRMDYAQEEYERLFRNIFKNIEGKKIYLFGSGKFAGQFISQFGKCHEIAGIVDNDEKKWGKTFSAMADAGNGKDLKISSPKELQKLEVSFRVFICIKDFESVMEQLKSMGIKDFVVYNPNLEHDRPLRQTHLEERQEPKKYHVGYVAGVFDLFHVGHLNLLRRAKELCDYLIAGVVSDEQVIKAKKTSPYIPFEERLQLVEACKYVDEAVRIPPEGPGTEEAYRLYHFDVQFSGSDYENNPNWIAKKVYLQQHGADMVFFPYTEQTSSTKIKARIQERDE